MVKMNYFLVLLVTFCCGWNLLESAQQPNIVLMVADDLGWTDVGFHGSDQIPTPNIDKLAKEGIILNNYYVQPICSPTRSALMTGRYPIHTGMYHNTIFIEEPWGLPLEEKTLPQYLKEMGYATHAIGKWHLGFFAKEYTPTYRGFDSFYGYYSGSEEYFSHCRPGADFDHFYGLDLRRDYHGISKPDWSQNGTYSSDLFASEAINVINNHGPDEPFFLYLPFQNTHAPLMAPKEWIDKFSYIENKNRKTFAAMVATLDDAIGKVHQALDEKGILDNTIIIFTSDNGAISTEGFSSNYPLRGVKHMVFEGGVRVPAFINSPLLKRSGVTSMQMMHVTDWLPTIVNLAQGKITKEIDGFDQWKTLQDDVESPRKEILLNIDNVEFRQEGLISGEWKIIIDSEHDIYASDGWIKAPGYNASGKATSVIKCGPKPETTTHCNKEHCLFNLHNDPCEYNDVSSQYPSIYQQMKTKLEDYKKGIVPNRNKPGDKMADPKLYGNVWSPWKKLN